MRGTGNINLRYFSKTICTMVNIYIIVYISGDKVVGIRESWRGKRFQVSPLESHNDLVTAVHCCDGFIVSARYVTLFKCLF